MLSCIPHTSCLEPLGIREVLLQKMRDFKRITQLLVDFRLFKKDKAAKPPVSTPGLTRFYQQNQSSTILLLFLKKPSPEITHSEKRRCSSLLSVGKLQCTTHNSRAPDITMQSKEKPRAKRSQVPISHSKTSQLTGSTVSFGANSV